MPAATVEKGRGEVNLKNKERHVIATLCVAAILKKNVVKKVENNECGILTQT